VTLAVLSYALLLELRLGGTNSPAIPIFELQAGLPVSLSHLIPPPCTSPHFFFTQSFQSNPLLLSNKQLGVFFFIGSLLSLIVGVFDFFSTSKKMLAKFGLVSVGKVTQFVTVYIGILTIISCTILIIADVG
jgi:hypothetical protein